MQTLLVASDPRLRSELEEALQTTSSAYISLDSAETAWRQVNSDTAPVLAVMSYQLSRGTASEVCQALRALNRDPYVYVIVVDPQPSESHMRHAFRSGANDYISWPVAPMDLACRLQVARRTLEVHLETRLAYETVPVPIFLLDDGAMIRRMNRAAAVLTGEEPDRFRHRPAGYALGCVHYVHQEDGCGQRDDCQNCMLRRMVTETIVLGRTFHRERVTLDRQGDSGHLELCFLVSTVRLPSSRDRTVLVCLEDMTEQNEVELRLRRNLMDLEEFNRLAIGRELRMIELKEEVNRLLEQQGLPHRYDVQADRGQDGCGVPQAGPQKHWVI